MPFSQTSTPIAQQPEIDVIAAAPTCPTTPRYPQHSNDMDFQVLATDATGALTKKSCSIAIAAAPSTPPDWSQLLWGAPVIVDTASFTPSSAMSDAFTADISFPAFDSTPDVTNTATLQYNGPAVNCNLHVVAVVNAGIAGASIRVRVNDWNVNTLLIERYGDTVPWHPSGTYDIPFVIPDTGGVSRQIDIWVHGDYLNLFANPGEGVNVAGTFSNV